MINLVVALASEARPLIDYYGLTLQCGVRAFPIYAKDNLRLVVTGIGKVQAAAGTAYLAGFDLNQHRPWLNVGIAGHRNLPTGTATFAHKITDHATKRSWYPPQVTNMPGTGVHITTYDQPVSDYPESLVCEMEAAAFYSVASRFSSGELVQCCKVISDNALSHVTDITPDLVKELIGNQLNAISRSVQALSDLSGGFARYDDSQIDVDQYYKYWHFTAAQKVQLREALRKVLVRGSVQMLNVGHWRHCQNAKTVLVELDQYLQSLAVSL